MLDVVRREDLNGCRRVFQKKPRVSGLKKMGKAEVAEEKEGGSGGRNDQDAADLSNLTVTTNSLSIVEIALSRPLLTAVCQPTRP